MSYFSCEEEAVRDKLKKYFREGLAWKENSSTFAPAFEGRNVLRNRQKADGE
ncbi:MAG: hypothetical protein IT223_12645 [Crocinitomicaceae bacterium]|nr:hypothetical protein [Crocinitomicaceae bacterium]